MSPQTMRVTLRSGAGRGAEALHGPGGRTAWPTTSLDSVESGTHVALYGLQRIGKTSLVEETLVEKIRGRRRLRDSTLFCRIDLQRMGADQLRLLFPGDPRSDGGRGPPADGPAGPAEYGRHFPSQVELEAAGPDAAVFRV